MPPVRKFSAFLNDPGSKGDVPEAVAPSASVSHFTIPGLPETGELDALKPGTVEFEASHLSVILPQAYDVWATYFGAPYDWEMGKLLNVLPRAGRDLNAYYDREA